MVVVHIIKGASMTLLLLQSITGFEKSELGEQHETRRVDRNLWGFDLILTLALTLRTLTADAHGRMMVLGHGCRLWDSLESHVTQTR